MAMKNEFLVCYDYGTGGLWAILRARSADEIRGKFSELLVIDEKPAWMDERRLADLKGDVHDIDDDPPFGWFAHLRQG